MTLHRQRNPFTSTPFTSTIVFAIFACLVLLPATGVLAQQSTDDNWRDRINETDVRYLGTVAKVMDNTFELRTHEHGVKTFTIPADADYRHAISTGNEVQVWVAGETVSYAVTYSDLATEEQVADNDGSADRGDESAQDESTQREATQSADAKTADQAATRTDAEQRAMDRSAEARSQREQAQREQAQEARSRDAAQTSTETSSQSWDEDVLPQTGSFLPALVGVGLLLIVAGAALRLGS